MTNSIIQFTFESSEVRSIVDAQGDPWFIASDVAKALGYARPNDAISAHCKKSQRIENIGYGETPYLQNQTLIIPQSDVVRLVARSKLESAERFQDWLFEEVVPSILKTGSYQAQPLTRAQLARNWADAEERAEYEAKRADHNKAVAIAKTAQLAQTESAISLITASEKSITMTEAAKPLGMKPHAFVAWMIANKWIYQSSGGYVANQIRINDGCLEQKFFDRNINEYIDEYHPARRPQVMVKVKGMAKLAKTFATVDEEVKS
jgi:anti-repressor protein